MSGGGGDASAFYREVCRMPAAGLRLLFDAGKRPEPAELAGWEWRGLNTPWFTNLLGIKKFVKGMFSGADGVEGYNIPARQNGASAPWLLRPSDQAPRRFGFYRVVEDDGRHPGSVLLDYGASARNAALQPERLLRDYVKEVGPGVLLGRAYLAFGSVYVPVSWFVLERLRKTEWAG